MLRQDMIRAGIGMIVSVALLSSAGANPDSNLPSRVSAFENAYRKWDAEDFARCAEGFAEMTRTNPQSPEAWYWLGVARFHRMLALQGDPNKRAQEATERDAAVSAFEKLLETDARHAEGHALLGTLLGMKIDGSMLRGLRYGPALQSHLKTAMQEGSQNPRVRYLLGVGYFHVAEDAADYRKALAELRQAEQYYQKENSKNLPPAAPRWGRSSNLTFYGLTLEKLGRKDEAVAEFRRALALHSADHKAREGIRRLGATP